MAFTSQALAKTEEALTRTREKMARLKETAEEAIGNGIQVTEVGGTAFLMGLANAKWGEDGEIKVLGVSLDLGVGFALTGVAMFGGLGKYAEHGVNVGSGALAAYAYRSGFQLGTEWAEEDDDADHQPKQSAKKTSAQRSQLNGRSAVMSGEPGQTYTVYGH